MRGGRCAFDRDVPARLRVFGGADGSRLSARSQPDVKLQQQQKVLDDCRRGSAHRLREKKLEKSGAVYVASATCCFSLRLSCNAVGIIIIPPHSLFIKCVADASLPQGKGIADALLARGPERSIVYIHSLNKHLPRFSRKRFVFPLSPPHCRRGRRARESRMPSWPADPSAFACASSPATPPAPPRSRWPSAARRWRG